VFLALTGATASDPFGPWQLYVKSHESMIKLKIDIINHKQLVLNTSEDLNVTYQIAVSGAADSSPILEALQRLHT
jgi:hypothetical protein